MCSAEKRGIIRNGAVGNDQNTGVANAAALCATFVISIYGNRTSGIIRNGAVGNDQRAGVKYTAANR